MKVEIIIFPEKFHFHSVKESVQLIIEKFEDVTENVVNIRYDLDKVDFAREDVDLYLLYCLNLHDFESIKIYSKKIILMNAIYTFMTDIVRNFDFAGIVSYIHFKQNLPMILGLNDIAKQMNATPNTATIFNSDKYEEILKVGSTPVDVLLEYAVKFHEVYH